MKAFNGSQKFKNELLKKALEHKSADDYVAGTFGEMKAFGFKGCSVGCTIYDIDSTHEKNDHEFLATKLGVPLFVVHLQDTLFEGKSNKSAWTYDFLKSINVNSDLTSVLPKILLYIVQLNPSKESYFEIVVKILKDWIENGFVDEEKAKLASLEEDYLATHSSLDVCTAALAASTVCESLVENTANWAAKAATKTSANALSRDTAFAATSKEWEAIEQKIFDDIAEEFLILIRECHD